MPRPISAEIVSPARRPEAPLMMILLEGASPLAAAYASPTGANTAPTASATIASRQRRRPNDSVRGIDIPDTLSPLTARRPKMLTGFDREYDNAPGARPH